MTLKRLLSKPVPRAEADPFIEQELCVILACCKPVRVYLFGSAARNEMTDSSDLDLLVVLPDGENIKEAVKKYYSRPKTHSWPVDILFMEEAEFARKSQLGGVAMLCAQEGQVLFEVKA